MSELGGGSGGHSHKPVGDNFPASGPQSARYYWFYAGIGICGCLRFVGWFASSGSQVCNDVYWFSIAI